MAGLTWLFAWAKEKGIELPLGADGAVDIRALLNLYDMERGGGKEYTARKKLRYTGPHAEGLTNGKVYEGTEQGEGKYEIIDDFGKKREILAKNFKKVK